MNMCACIEHGVREARSSHIEAETDRAVWDGLLFSARVSGAGE